MSDVDDFEGVGEVPNWAPFNYLVEAATMAFEEIRREEELIKERNCRTNLGFFLRPLGVRCKEYSFENLFGLSSPDDDSVYGESLTEPILPLNLVARKGKRSLRTKKSFNKITFRGPVDTQKGERLIYEKSFMESVTDSVDINMEEGFMTQKIINKPDKEATKTCPKRRRHESKETEPEEARVKKKVKRNMNAMPEILPNLSPELPIEFRILIQNMGGSQEMLIIQKPLYKTDLSRSHGRLSIPQSQIKTDFLTAVERELLNESELKVKLIEPCLEHSYIHLRKWDMNTRAIYVLVNSWNEVLSKKKNGLEEGMMVQLWSFRVDSELCLALVVI
ncbi:unnamed protein product [Ilex paraguariensis]